MEKVVRPFIIGGIINHYVYSRSEEATVGNKKDFYTSLDVARFMYDGLRPGDRAFFMARVAVDYLTKVYGAKSECVKYATDWQIKAFKKSEWVKERSNGGKTPPLPR